MSTRLRPGQTVRVSILTGRASDRITFDTHVVEATPASGLLLGTFPDGAPIVLQRPNGEVVDKGRRIEVLA